MARDSLTHSTFDGSRLADAFVHVPPLSKFVIPIARQVMFDMHHYVSRSASTFYEWSYYYDLKSHLEDALSQELKLLRETNQLLKRVPVNNISAFADLDALSKALFQDQSTQVWAFFLNVIG